MSLQESKFRTDIQLVRQEGRDGVHFTFKDAVTGRVFRFGELEHFVISQLDGETRADLILGRASQEFGGNLSPVTLASFINSLQKNGLLESREAKVSGEMRSRRRFFGSPLYFRVAAFDPDRRLTRIEPRIGFMFTRTFVVLSALTMVLAACVAIGAWSEIFRDLRYLYRFNFEVILLTWVTLYVVTAAHEFAHALTCKHFGGEVHEMGVLLLYFQPAFYCNITDAWLLPRKSQRLWVTLAGAYWEMFVCALATLAWRLFEPGTGPNSLALAIMLTSAIKTCFNLNPLIKLDGYYLLSDYLEIPNLRRKSFAYLRTMFRNAVGTLPDQIGARHRRIYIAYGLLAGAYSFSLLSLILIHFGGYLTRRYQAAGFIGFTAFVAMIFQPQISKILPARSRELESSRASAARPGWIRRVNRLLKISLLGAIISGILYFGQIELKVASDFRILPAINADVRAEVEGIIDQIYDDEGAVVRKGDPIVRLSVRDLRSDLQISDAAIAEKRAKLKLLTAGSRPEEIEVARRAVETAKTRREYASTRFQEGQRIHAEGLTKAEATRLKAKERLSYASGYLDQAKLLFQESLISRQEIDKSREEVAVRQKELEEADAELKILSADDLAEFKRGLAVSEKELDQAEGSLALLLSGSRAEDLEATRAEIDNQEARGQHIRDQMDLMDVRSPISGVITTPKLKQRIGQLVSRGDLIATVHELNTVMAEIVTPEKDIANVRVGQKVVLKARAFPGNSFTGDVTSIAPIATKPDAAMDERYVLVSCRVDNPSLLLKAEMTGKAKIYCGKRRIMEVLFGAMSRYLRVEFWSWW
jgi:putative peptide zinc metalloprotease protein